MWVHMGWAAFIYVLCSGGLRVAFLGVRFLNVVLRWLVSCVVWGVFLMWVVLLCFFSCVNLLFRFFSVFNKGPDSLVVVKGFEYSVWVSGGADNWLSDNRRKRLTCKIAQLW